MSRQFLFYLRIQLLFVVVIVVEWFSHCINHILWIQTEIRNIDKDIYILLQTIKRMYVFVHKSSFLSFFHSCSVFQDLTINETKCKFFSLSLAFFLYFFFFFSFSFFSYVFFSYTQSFGDCYCFEKMDINIVWVFN